MFRMLPKLDTWIDLMADELAEMFNKLTVEEMEPQEEDFKWKAGEEEPIVGKDMNFKDVSVSGSYSEGSEESDGKVYQTDESDKSIGGSDDKLEVTAHLLIPKGIVSMYVKDIMEKENKDLDIEEEALEAIHTSLEAHLIKLFQYSKMIANHYNRKEISGLDITLAEKFI